MSRQVSYRPNLIATISEFERSPDRGKLWRTYQRVYAAQLTVFPAVQS